MKNNIKIEKNSLIISDYKKLCKSADWYIPSDYQIKIALENSIVIISLKYDDEVIGMVRLCGDKGIFFVIRELVILKEFRGRGYGKLLLFETVEYIKNICTNHSLINIDIQSTPEAVGFYNKIGFSQPKNGLIFFSKNLKL